MSGQHKTSSLGKGDLNVKAEWLLFLKVLK